MLLPCRRPRSQARWSAENRNLRERYIYLFRSVCSVKGVQLRVVNTSESKRMKWPEPGYINSESSEKKITLHLAKSKERCAPLRGRHTKMVALGLRVGFWESREGRSRRRRCAAVRFDAANESRGLTDEVLCGAPPATGARPSVHL
jgi:hypothetical protein